MDLTLKQFTLKKVALVALVSAQRSQTFAALCLHFMNKIGDAIVLMIQSILKTSA